MTDQVFKKACGICHNQHCQILSDSKVPKVPSLNLCCSNTCFTYCTGGLEIASDSQIQETCQHYSTYTLQAGIAHYTDKEQALALFCYVLQLKSLISRKMHWQQHLRHDLNRVDMSLSKVSMVCTALSFQLSAVLRLKHLGCWRCAKASLVGTWSI